jgi:cytochrome c-type biogenesis protein
VDVPAINVFLTALRENFTTFGGAGLAGLISFLSPCVLPLVPPYLCYMAGVSLDQLTGEGEARIARRTVITASIAFVLGFSTVFVMLGATASTIGRWLRSPIDTGVLLSGGGNSFLNLSRIYPLDVLGFLSGIVIIVMGLHFLGVLRIAFLSREARFQVGTKAAGPVTAYVMGLAFAFGWTPCIGPVLAAILAVAGSQATVARGALLLTAYSLGLGIPFIIAGLFSGPFLAFMRRFRSHLGTVEKVMGGLLVVTGLLFITGGMANLSYWLLETFPALSNIG